MFLKDIESFVRVAEARSFRRAAIVEGVPPSTMSRRVARMESELGVSMFERHNGGVRLTTAGLDFFAVASKALGDIEYGRRRARSAGKGASGHLRIGIFASIASGFAHRAIRAFRAAYPDVEIEIAEGEPRTHLRRIRERETDIAFITGQFDLHDLDSEVMWSERVALALASTHPAAQSSPLRWSDLRAERFIVSLQEPGPEIHDWLVARLGGLSEPTDIVRFAVARETLFVRVGLGLGLTVVSEAGTGVAYPNVVFRSVDGSDDILPFSAVWRRETDNPSLRRFIAMMRATNAGRPPPPTE